LSLPQLAALVELATLMGLAALVAIKEVWRLGLHTHMYRKWSQQNM